MFIQFERHTGASGRLQDHARAQDRNTSEDTYRELDIPAEIWIRVFHFLKKRTKDIKNIRQVCRTFNFAASQFLVVNVYYSSCQRDLARLQDIAKHPVFSKYVTTLIYDSRIYEESLAESKQDYFRAIDFELQGHSRWRAEITRLAFPHYVKCVLEQQRTREKVSIFSYLSGAFTAMPQMQQVKIVGDMNWRKPFTDSREGTDRRSNGQRILLPRVASIFTQANPAKAEQHAAMWRQAMVEFFHTLCEPSIARQLRVIKACQTSLETHFSEQLTVSLPYPSLQPRDEHVQFERLEELYMTVGSGYAPEQGIQWYLGSQQPSPKALELLSCRFGPLLGAALNLQVLLLEFHRVYLHSGVGVNLNDLFDRTYFPCLRDFSLIGVPCLEAGLLKFINKHRKSLKRLSIHPDKRISNWSSFMEKLRDIDTHLNAICLGNGRSFQHLSPFGPKFWEMNVEEKFTLQYLYEGGPHPFLDLPTL